MSASSVACFATTGISRVAKIMSLPDSNCDSDL